MPKTNLSMKSGMEKKLNHARKIHKEFKGVDEFSICKKCYLPRKTEPETLYLHGRKVLAENYTNRAQLIGK